MPKFLIWSDWENPTVFSKEELATIPHEDLVNEDGFKERGFCYDLLMKDFDPEHDAIKWAEENLKEDFTSMGGVLFFKSADDRMMFGLRWL